MKTYCNNAFMAILVLFLVMGCGGGKQGSETENKDSVPMTQSSEYSNKTANLLPPPEPVPTYRAFENIRRYRDKINPKGEYGDYVWGNIDSMYAMLDHFRGKGKTHIKMYFALDEKNNCGRVSQNLNIVFEGARMEGTCNPEMCEPCQLNEDPVGNGYSFSYNLNHPCPPPPCWGRSRYYIYSIQKPDSSSKVKAELRNKPE